MNENLKSRNRLRGMYEENIAGLTTDYAQLRRRLLDLSLESIRNKRAIDDMLLRLQPALRLSLLEH